MKIVHLASQHRATDPRIFQKECRTLARAGHEVTYICPHDRDEVVDGVQILGVPIPGDGRERFGSTLGQIYRRALTQPEHAVFHYHDAELVLHMLALKAQGRRVVYDAHEDTPRQIMYQHWIPSWMRRPLSLTMGGLEWIAGRLFDGIIVAEPATMRHAPSGKRVLVRNYPLADELLTSSARSYTERPPVIAYIGAITEVRGVREMVEAVRGLPGRTGAELVLGGPFHPASLEDDVRSMAGSERTRLLGWVNRRQVGDVLSRARIGLVTLHPTPKYLDSYPTKLFEYMSAGIPVVASDFPVWRPFVEEARCGLLVDPMDPGAIREAVQWLLEHPEEAEAMGRRGREAVLERYNWEQEAPKLVTFYDQLDEE